MPRNKRLRGRKVLGLDAEPGGIPVESVECEPPADPVTQIVTRHRAGETYQEHQRSVQFTAPNEITSQGQDRFFWNGKPHVSQDNDHKYSCISPVL